MTRPEAKAGDGDGAETWGDAGRGTMKMGEAEREARPGEHRSWVRGGALAHRCGPCASDAAEGAGDGESLGPGAAGPETEEGEGG